MTFERNAHYRDERSAFPGPSDLQDGAEPGGGQRADQDRRDRHLVEPRRYQIPDFERLADVKLAITSSSLSEKLVLNQSAGGDPAAPHPILGDRRVRQALQYAINKRVLVDKLLFGKAKFGASEVPHRWRRIRPSSRASSTRTGPGKLLREAGWQDTDRDGVLDKGGQPLKLRLSTTSGDKLRELVEHDSSRSRSGPSVWPSRSRTCFPLCSSAQWGDRSPRKRGTYDIQMYSPGPSIDPDAYLYGFYHSSQIPTEANPGPGTTPAGIAAPTSTGQSEARATVDLDKRRKAYIRAARLLNEDLPVIILYTRLFVVPTARASAATPRTPGRGWDGTPRTGTWRSEASPATPSGASCRRCPFSSGSRWGSSC